MSDPRPPDGECCLAVIGLACRLPGAGDETAYWSDLAAGRSRLARLSENELEAHGTGPRDRADPRVIRSFGVLDGVDRFDADFFGIPPRRAARLDPQQRILLEMAWRAMEQAGQAPGDPEQVVGTFVALTSSGYVPAAAAGDEDAVFDLTSAEKDYAATRIAHKLGLTGPAVVVQSACSSALLAVHTACEALLGGQCDLAIAGGISIALPQGAYRHVPGLMLSPTGSCRVFDAAADGTVPGNGGGLVVLKPLARALADGDPIRAVIRGSAANNDGAVKADYLAPSVQGQALAVGEALTVAGLDPADIGLIEAHATGTRLGDPIEIEALSRVFAGVPAGTIAVGSAKASIGHLNAASGIAGLVKAILALENATIPPVPGFATPNPEIAFGGSPFYVPFAARPWPPPARGRRAAGVSSFGFGGTNVHVVLEEAPVPADRPACGKGPFPLLLSALDGARLEAAALALADALEADPAIRVDDVAWTLLAGRKSMPARRAAMVSNRDQAVAWLRGAAGDAPLPDPIDAWLRGGALRPAAWRPAGARAVRLPGTRFAPQRHWTELSGRSAAPTGIAWMDGGYSPPAPVPRLPPPRTGPAAGDRTAAVLAHVVAVMAEAVGRPDAEIDTAAPLAGFGLDSLLTVGVTNRLKADFPELRDTELFEQQSLDSLARHLLVAFPGRAGALAAPEVATAVPGNGGSVPVAVIGMAGRYPGAPDLDRFWRNLRDGVGSIREVAPERWSAADFTDPSRPDRATVRTGGFIDGVDRFDPLFFGIAPKEARLMDPQHRLFLECAWQAVEEAGYTPAGLKACAPSAGGPAAGGDVGVFVGVMNQPYRLVGLPATAAGKVVQNGHWSVANRVSYHLDFNGPSLAVDTACSASLTAVHLACASLARGECAVAVAGGVNLILHPLQSLELGRMGMLSPSDACRPFADGADGTLQGEGVGALVLKPLDRALADGDPIRAVILGSAVNAGGRTAGYTVPSPVAQRRAIAAALAEAGVGGGDIAHVECHGTGTDLGDPIELNALADALDGGAARPEPVVVGSVKGNIGHLEAAAGVAGLTKLVLEIEAGRVAPTLGADRPTRRVDFARTRLLPAATLMPWPARRDRAGLPLPRRGGVSSFGAGGANAHVVVEQAPARQPRAAAPAGRLSLLLSARAPERLPALAERLAARIEALAATEADPRALLADVAFTLAVGRVRFEHMASVEAATVTEAVVGLRSIGQGAAVIADPAAWERVAASLGSGRRRVALPGYPFNGDSYWVDGAPRPIPIPADGPVLPGRAPTGIAPADDGHRLHLPAGSPVIDLHRVRGRPTLPGVASALAALRAAEAAGFGACRRVRDIVWLRPLAAADGPVEARIALVAGERDIGFEIAGPDGLACRGRIEPTGDPLALPVPEDGQEWSAEALYDRLLETGLDYRADYRPIRSVRVSPHGAVAELDMAVIGTGFADWPLPPPLLDAALQVAAASTLPADGGPAPTLVPFSAAWIDLAPEAARDWRRAARIVARPVPAVTGDPVRRYDAAILTADGRPLASVSGLVARPLGVPRRIAAAAEPVAAPVSVPETGIGDWAFVPVWRPLPVEPAAAPARAVVLAAEGAGSFAARLSGRIAEGRVAAMPRPGDEDAAQALAGAVREAGCLVLVLAGAGGEGLAPPLGLLAVLRALKRSALLDPLRILVVSEAALDVGDGDLPDPAVAGMLGIVRVAARECRRWRVACVDLPAHPGDAAVDLALADPGDAKGREVALRWRVGDLVRLAARLERRALPPAPRPAWRPGGHVAIVGGAGGIGAALAERLAARNRARLTLVGRSPESDAIRALLARIEAAGGQAVYASADAADPAALAAALAAGRDRFGPIHTAIHSAIVMQDRALDGLDDETFARAFAVKAAGTAALARATRGDPLDRLLLFSSANSFAAMAGQANYVAGCLVKDALGRRLAAEGRPVRIVNWGFWGEVGRVATPDYRDRLARSGVEPISTAEGLDAIDRVVTAAEFGGQVLVLKAGDQTLREVGAVEDAPAASGAGTTPVAAAPVDGIEDASGEYEALDRIARGEIARWLAGQGVLGAPGERFRLGALEDRLAPAPRHARLVDALVDMLVCDGTLGAEPGGLVVRRAAPDAAALLAGRAALLAARPAYRAHLGLLDACLSAYGAVLRDDRPATDVLFPGGSLDLVAPMYTGNPMVDAFNDRAADAVAAAVPGGGRGSILEFGAGTGSLTAALLPKLDRIGGVSSYRFTDLSLGFCRAAERRFATGRPWFGTGLLDIGRPAAGQGLEPGSYDVVVGANVIHATPSIADSLATARSLLRPGGTLVLYEMMAPHDFVTVTFGLLDGWWVATDARLPHSPLLDAGLWREALAAAGFPEVEIVDGRRHGIVVARPAAASRVPRPPVPAETRNPLLRARAARRDEAAPDASESGEAELVAAAESLVIEALVEALEMPAHEVRPDRAFADMGTDSLLSVDVVAALARRLGIELKPTVLFSNPTVRQLAVHLAALAPQALRTGASVPRSVPVARDPERPAADRGDGSAIAIVGASGRFPGAVDLDAFWAAIAAGRDSVGPVPAQRWDHRALLAASPAPAGRTDCPDGGFLADVELFDPLFFGLSPAEAAAMDPQQRILLEECWRALEDAARAGADLPGSRTGVFVGTVTGDYQDRLRAAGAPADVHAFMGSAASMTAARVAYHLDLRGPALSIDTACSSALVAVHQAVESLRAGACDTALAGGVAVMTTPGFYVAAASAGMLSPGGRCRALDAGADGFVPGEGVAVFVLRRLADALRDGDPVRAVIRASGVNQDGASNGITAPNGAAQHALLASLYRTGGVDPSGVRLVELHGTGTRLGDPIEMEALAAAFATAAPPAGGWRVGSVKSNIGHALPAAGAAGLAKAMLALEQGVLPPTLHVARPNPLIDGLGGRFAAQARAEPWPADAPRRAGVSAFGFGGTNAHVVVEEAPSRPAGGAGEGTALPVVLSAASPAALAAARRTLAAWLEGTGRDAALADIAVTLATGRKAMRHRWAAVVRSRADLLRTLSQETPETEAAGPLGDFLAGRPADWAPVFDGLGARRIRLPTYRFDRRRCWPAERREPAPAVETLPLSARIANDLDRPLYAEAGE